MFKPWNIKLRPRDLLAVLWLCIYLLVDAAYSFLPQSWGGVVAGFIIAAGLDGAYVIGIYEAKIGAKL